MVDIGGENSLAKNKYVPIGLEPCTGAEKETKMVCLLTHTDYGSNAQKSDVEKGAKNGLFTNKYGSVGRQSDVEKKHN